MRFPLIHQHDASDCGPAALAMIAARHGKRIGIARFRELAGTDRTGTTLAGLIIAAQTVGFDARGVRATKEALADVQLPAIAHWHEDQRNHFVVIDKITKHYVAIADPALGRRKLHKEDFHKHWTGVLLLLTETATLRNAVATPTTYTRLTTLLLPHRHLFLDVLLAAVLMTILGLASSFFIQALVDNVFVFGRLPALNWLGLGMLLVLVARTAFLALRTYLLAHLSQRIDVDTVLGFHRHLLGLPLSFFSTRRTGEILSRMNDAVKIRIAVSATTLSVIVDTLLLIGSAAVMLAINWRATLPSILLIPGIGGFVWIFNLSMKRHQHDAMAKAAEIDAMVVETISGIQSIKALRGELSCRTRLESRFSDLIGSSFQGQMMASHCTTLTTLASGLAWIGLLYFGGRDVLDGTMTVGQLMALNAMMGMFLGPLERLVNANQTIQDAIIASDRLGEVFELETESAKERESAIERPLVGSVEFRDVSFRVVAHFSARIRAGECVGIVGPSGVGKTSLIQLLGRFFEPASGEILIDGIDIRDYTLPCLRKEIGFVPQDIVLFQGTIAENIRMGNPYSSSEEIFQAARSAGLNRVHTMVGERGLALSGGERQRVAIARAILQNPSILVLDEPTSHLDAASEAAVEALIESRRGKKTTIVVSHRQLGFDRVIQV